VKKCTIQSEITGTVWKIVTSVGDPVTQDQELVILESMKMEIPALAPEAGTVREILVKEGDSIKEGQDLVIVERA
jgi:acetyl-CoA carboxylase biotin carboxyl carrier protein